MAVTSQQVTLYMSQRQQGQIQEIAAAKAGLSIRTARCLERHTESAESPAPHHWRTSPDPFAEVWEQRLVPQLATTPGLQVEVQGRWS